MSCRLESTIFFPDPNNQTIRMKVWMDQAAGVVMKVEGSQNEMPGSGDVRQEYTTPGQWQETIDTNLSGVFYSIKAGVGALKASKGFFITISSLAGTNFFAGGSAYNASKFGLTGFTQAVMLDLRHHGVRVSTIMPGSVATNFGSGSGSADAWKIQIEDIGKLVVDLMKLDPRTLPSKIEVRPSQPPRK